MNYCIVLSLRHVQRLYHLFQNPAHDRESNPHAIIIRTSFCRFLKRKKQLVRGSNPQLSFNRSLPTRQTD